VPGNWHEWLRPLPVMDFLFKKNLMRNNKLTKDETKEITKNAVTSFMHGIQHLVQYKDEERNTKFAILHVFNAVELFVKAYLGQENVYLLQEKIDDKKLSDKTASIMVLLERMRKFSEVSFEKMLEEKINNLRDMRNNIEHKRFVLKDSLKTMKTLFDVIYGLVYFTKTHLYQELLECCDNKIIDELNMVREEIFPEISDILEKANKFRQKGIRIAKCPRCLIETVPFETESIVGCLYCKRTIVAGQCYQCKKISIWPYPEEEKGELLLCDECFTHTVNEECGEIEKDYYIKERDKYISNLPKKSYKL